MRQAKAHPPSRREMLTQDARRLVLRLCAPCMLSTLSSGAGALLDALLLSAGGAATTAAVGLSFPLTALLQAIGFTLGTGAGSFISRSLGRGDEEAARRAASCALVAALAASGALALAGWPFAAPLLSLLGAPSEALSGGVLYARYVLLSGPMLCASLVLGSLLRGQGRAWPVGAAYAIGSAVGAALCALLARSLRWGLRGAGVALLAREAVTLALLAAATARGAQRPDPRLFTLSPAVWRDILRSGAPALLRQGMAGVSGALLNRASAAMGGVALAGMSLAVRVVSLIASAVIGFGQGFQPVCGFAAGAGDASRVREAYRFCQRAAALSLALAGALLYAFAGPLLSRMGARADVAAFGARALRAQAPVLWAQGAVILMNMLTQSLGLTLRASLVAASRQGYLLWPMLFLLPRFLGETGLVLAQSAADLLALPVCLLLTRGAIDGVSPQRRAAPPRPALAGAD